MLLECQGELVLLHALQWRFDDSPVAIGCAATTEDQFIGELVEPDVQLRRMTDGGEVVSDYSNVGLSLRSHPVSFLRDDLRRIRILSCSEAMSTRNNHWINLAGLVLVRQMPGSAKGVMFVTIEDETGVANLIVWPKIFEMHRRIVLGASMMQIHGKVQREGEVTHIIARKLIDLSSELATVGGRDGQLSLRHGRGDEFSHGGPGVDQRTQPPRDFKQRDIYVPDLHIDTIKVEGRTFH